MTITQKCCCCDSQVTLKFDEEIVNFNGDLYCGCQKEDYEEIPHEGSFIINGEEVFWEIDIKENPEGGADFGFLVDEIELVKNQSSGFCGEDYQY